MNRNPAACGYQSTYTVLRLDVMNLMRLTAAMNITSICTTEAFEIAVS